MSAALASYRAAALPWALSPEDEARFGRIRLRVIGASVIACLVLPWLPVREPERPAPPPPPVAMVTLPLERAPLPVLPLRRAEPPPPIATAPQDAPRAVPTEPKPTPSKSPVVTEARQPQPNKPPGEALDTARRKASGVGLLAMKNELAELHGAPVAVQLKPVALGAGVGTGVGVGVGAGTEAGLPTRALITSNAAGGSGGINTAAYSRNTGGGGLAGRSTTLVEGVAGGGGGGGAGVGGGGRGDGTGTGSAGARGGTLQRSGSGKASRSIEEIKLVFERHKGAIYAIYNRALRDEPALQGKVVLELKIAPTGEVSAVRVVSSELNAEELERKLLARIRQFEFGAKDVEPMVVSWPVDFLPS